MKKLAILFIFALFISCSAGHSIMTMENFEAVELDSSSKNLEKTAGKPYSTKRLADGTIEYEYIERVTAGDRVIAMRHYIFHIKNGVVQSKSYFTETIPPLDQRNSYELQTSHLNKKD